MTGLIIQSTRTIYNVIANFDETAKLFSLYPSIQRASKEIISNTKIQAAALIRETEENYFKLDPTKELDSETRLNRLAFIVFSKLLSPEKVQAQLEEYNKIEQTTLGYVASWIPGVSLATSFISSIFSVFSHQTRPLDCSLQPSDQEPAEYVICKQAAAFFAEKKVQELVSQPHIFPETTHLHPDTMKNLGAFIVATEEDKIALSISPDKVRELWIKTYRFDFCKNRTPTPNKKTICKDRKKNRIISDFNWRDTLTSQLNSLPSKLRTEISENLSKKPAKDMPNNEEL